MTNYYLLDYDTLEKKWNRKFEVFNDAFMFMELYSIKAYIVSKDDEIVWDPSWDTIEEKNIVH